MVSSNAMYRAFNCIAVAIVVFVGFVSLLAELQMLLDKGIFPISFIGLCNNASENSTYTEFHYDGTCPLHPSVWEATDRQWAEYEALGKPPMDCETTPIRNILCIHMLGEILSVERPCPVKYRK